MRNRRAHLFRFDVLFVTVAMFDMREPRRHLFARHLRRVVLSHVPGEYGFVAEVLRDLLTNVAMSHSRRSLSWLLLRLVPKSPS